MNLFVEMYKYLIDTFDLFKLFQTKYIYVPLFDVNIVNAKSNTL